MQLKPMRVGRVRLYSEGLSGEEAGLTGVERVASTRGRDRRQHGAATAIPNVAFVPEGPYVVPVHAAEAR